jgi:hypothetical protein
MCIKWINIVKSHCEFLSLSDKVFAELDVEMI